MSSYKVLYVFVEGPDDARFMKSVVISLFESKYSYIKPIEYSKMGKGEVSKLIRTAASVPNIDYLFFCDFDSHGDENQCITNRKAKKVAEYGNLLDLNRIVVVKEMIEGWYAAGISDGLAAMEGVITPESTDTLDKGKFSLLMPKVFRSKTDFMVEILKGFDINLAKNRNQSFGYFYRKHMTG